MMVDLLSGLTIPDSWIELLKQIQKQDPKAVIAGGAIRDKWCLRGPIKDIDIFCTKPAYLPQFRNQPPQQEYNGSNPYVQQILYYPDAAPLPINIVIGTGYLSTYQLLETFDFGLCQIAFDGLRIIKTWAFDWDHRRREMTLRLDERRGRRRESSLARFERWREKYPEFTLVEVEEITEDGT